MTTIPQSSESARDRLVEALNLDLVGPWAGHALSDEKLPGWIRPSTWYLSGFLVPTDAPLEQRSDADEDDDLDTVPDHGGLPEESAEERKAAKRSLFPSSMGLSFLVPKEANTLAVTVRWGDYEHEARKTGGQAGDEPSEPSVWRRRPEERTLQVDLSKPGDCAVPDSGSGLVLHVVERRIKTESLTDIPVGTRSVSLFLVNRRAPNVEEANLAYAFQAEIEVRSAQGFVPRPDPRRARAGDWDADVADLHYADTPEYAAGHGISADWEVVEGACRVLRTTWIPQAHVAKTDTVDMPDVVLSMDALGALQDGPAATHALTPLVRDYRAWIDARREEVARLDGARRETGEEMLRRAGLAADRIEGGIAVLSGDAEALDAFRLANRAVATAMRQRLDIEAPAWRAFQLAFLLLNLAGLVDGNHPERRMVDLLFFPTGGGKTEAYLALAAFEIGLWVGKAATPNVMGRKGERGSDSARSKTNRFQRNPDSNPSPIPLENCPWCGARFTPNSFTLEPNADAPEHLRVVCADYECDFSGDRPLPIVAVDEPLYRRLPAFLIATVDKFASLPWVG